MKKTNELSRPTVETFTNLLKTRQKKEDSSARPTHNVETTHKAYQPTWFGLGRKQINAEVAMHRVANNKPVDIVETRNRWSNRPSSTTTRLISTTRLENYVAIEGKLDQRGELHRIGGLLEYIEDSASTNSLVEIRADDLEEAKLSPLDAAERMVLGGRLRLVPYFSGQRGGTVIIESEKELMAFICAMRHTGKPGTAQNKGQLVKRLMREYLEKGAVAG